MLKKMFIVMAVIFITGSTAFALKVGGITLPDKLKAENAELTLNGAGLRKVFGFKVYAGGLYLKKKSSDSESIINADETMAIRLQWRRSGPKDKLNEVYFKSFAKSAGAPKAKVYGPDTDFGPLSKDIVLFMSWLTVRKAEKGHYWNNIYIPGEGTKVYMYDGQKETHVGTIKGLEFKKVLFSIWLGDDSTRHVSKKLKSRMLGKAYKATDKTLAVDTKGSNADSALDELDNI